MTPDTIIKLRYICITTVFRIFYFKCMFIFLRYQLARNIKLILVFVFFGIKRYTCTMTYR